MSSRLRMNAGTTQLAPAQLLKLWRGRQELIRPDSAGGTHAFLDWLSRRAGGGRIPRNDYHRCHIHQAALKIPRKAWTSA